MNRKLKVNDCVIVINSGKRYSTYSWMATEMNLSNYVHRGLHCEYNGRTGKIISIKKHQESPYVLLCGVNVGDEDIIMGISGLKRFPRIKYELIKRESNNI